VSFRERLQQKLGRKAGPVLWLSTLLAGAGIGACAVTAGQQRGAASNAAPASAAVDPFFSRAATAAPAYAPGGEPIVKAVQKAAPAVVSIDTTARQVYRVFDDPFEAMTGRGGRVESRQVPTGAGSGVILSGGYVLTNQHVVGDAVNTGGTLRVSLADGRAFDATPVGADFRTDIALLKLKTTETVPVMPLGAQDALVPGQTVIAIGNPVGLSASVSAGVVSALGRPLTMEGRAYENLIQTDTAINPGNSGGALIDLAGNLVGINTLVRSDAQNIGFAIPIKTALRIADTLKRYGRVRRPDLGMVPAELSPRLARYLGLERGTRGVVVAAVYRGSPAAEAGLRRLDVVTAVGGVPVVDEASFQRAVEQLSLGQTTTLTVLREGERSQVRVGVAEAPQ